jgi:hypothetical protein
MLGLLPFPAASGQEPGVDARVSQFAYATAIVHKGGADYMYIAGAQRMTRVDGRTKTTGYAKKSKCVTLERKHIKLIACAAFVFPHRIPDAAFEFDPLLESASVRMKDKGGATGMSWAGRGTPEPYAQPYADASYGGAYAEVYRIAKARGKILGERYPRGWMGFALLNEGVMAEGYTSRNVSIAPLDNGAYRVTALYRVPR